MGNNTLVESQRVLTSIELFIHADFYPKHPLSAINEHDEFFKNISDYLPLSLAREF